MTGPISTDKTMAKWPRDINSDRDLLNPPYPCQTCKVPFKSCKQLRTHKCVINPKKVPENA